MTRQLVFSQLLDRACGTMLRLNWLIALLSLIPLLFALLALVAASMVVVYILIMMVLVILSFGLLLLSDQFRAMFNADGLEQIQPMVNGVINAYRSAMPVIIVLSVVFCALSIAIVMLRKQSRGKTSSIVSATLALIVVVIAACIYYGYVGQVTL